MRHNPAILRTITLTLGLLLAPAGAASAQDDSSLFVGKPVPVASVKRVVKRGRVVRSARPRPQVARVPLLAVQMRLLKVKQDGSAVETNPVAQFYADDRLRLAVTANQSGYLTIIRQADPEADGEILFPSSLLNDGAYYVPRAAGTEIFTVIFSRDLILDLPENATPAAGAIKAQLIREIESSSVRQLDVKPGASRFALLVVNTDRNDNEEIFTRFGVTSRGPSPLGR